MKFRISIIGLLLLVASCKSSYLPSIKATSLLDINLEQDDKKLVNLKNYSRDFVLDMRYATDNNFLKKKVYPCDECYLQVAAVKSLLAANEEFLQLGYRIKLFDCYRPLAIQKKMWKLVPDANYVANPKKGSIHNRGGAVDITLVDQYGNEVPMGTDFDFFGKEASHSYLDLPEEILKNRTFLKEMMLKHNFSALNSEWWHYNLTGTQKDEVLNFKWRCD